jgi:hypothetical protein
MMAWAKALEERGDPDKARYVAARLKEFRNDQTQSSSLHVDRARRRARPWRSSARRRRGRSASRTSASSAPPGGAVG